MIGLRVLAGTFAMLATVVAAEVLDRPTGESEIPAASPPQALATPAAAIGPDPSQTQAWSAIMLARPLFTPDRRPQARSVAAAVQETALPRLSGIVSSPNLRFAIFQGEHAPHATVVPDGGAIEGWKVAGIGETTVTLARDGSPSVTLRPRYASGAVAIAATAPRPVPVSRWVNPASSGLLHTRWSNPQLQP